MLNVLRLNLMYQSFYDFFINRRHLLWNFNYLLNNYLNFLRNLHNFLNYSRYYNDLLNNFLNFHYLWNFYYFFNYLFNNNLFRSNPVEEIGNRNCFFFLKDNRLLTFQKDRFFLNKRNWVPFLDKDLLFSLYFYMFNFLSMNSNYFLDNLFLCFDDIKLTVWLDKNGTYICNVYGVLREQILEKLQHWSNDGVTDRLGNPIPNFCGQRLSPPP